MAPQTAAPSTDYFGSNRLLSATGIDAGPSHTTITRRKVAACVHYDQGGRRGTGAATIPDDLVLVRQSRPKLGQRSDASRFPRRAAHICRPWPLRSKDEGSRARDRQTDHPPPSLRLTFGCIAATTTLILSQPLRARRPDVPAFPLDCR